jgi:hypothetical protein
MRPHVVAKLKPTWRFDDKAHVFRDLESGRTSDALRRLPAGSSVVATAPTLAGADPQKLSADERNLARYVQILLPEGARAADALKEVQGWDFVESAELPPSVVLP